MGELEASGKPFGVSRAEVWDAWVKVRGNRGSGGVDGVSVEVFGKGLEGNLCRVWSRVASGTCFPPDVKVVAIAKREGAGVF
jgi:RNA-directed DNA polymerase